MPSVTQRFMGFTNQIAVDLGLMNREQSVEILSIQGRFLALAEKGIKPTERFIDADPLFGQVKDHWSELAKEHGISEADFLHHFARASSGKGFERGEAPATGDIANALKYVTKDVKNAILTAQAAVRTEQILKDITDPKVEAKSAEDIVKQHGRIDYEGKFDPPELVAAQINNKKADELHLFAKTNQQFAREEFEAVQAGSAQAYKDAAHMFESLDIPAAKLIAQELNRAAQEMGKQR